MSTDPGLSPARTRSNERPAVAGSPPLESQQHHREKTMDPSSTSSSTTEGPADANLPNGDVKEPNGQVVSFPDGGLRAWLVVAGSSHILFCTFGFVNAWGVFQDYYQRELFPERSSSEIGWIGSLQYMLIYLPALFMGRLVDTSKFQYPFWVAAILYPVAAILTAQVTKYWHAILAHGVLFGLSAGILFCPAITVVTHWFYHRRALALGVVACSSSLGGTVFPIIAINCLRTVGFPWTMRICGFICLYCTVFASLMLRTRLPPKPAPGGLFNLKEFKRPAFAFFALAAFLIMGGLYTPLSYIDVMGTQLGLGDYSTYLIAIANACSIIGRIGPSLFADKVGALNFLIPGLIGSAVTTFAWPYGTTKGGLTAVAATNGIFQGSYVSLLAPASAALGNVEDIGRRFGMVNTIMAFGSFLSAPVSGAILEKASFHEVSYYAGALILAGCACMIATRQFHLKKLWGKL